MPLVVLPLVVLFVTTGRNAQESVLHSTVGARRGRSSRLHFEEVNSAEDLLPRQGDDFRCLMAPAEDDPLHGLINSQLSSKKPELLKHSLLAINRSTSGRTT